MTRTAISRRVAEQLRSASWIRAMFERGLQLKARHGADNVFDFSLGNPNARPPEAFFDAVQAVAAERASEPHRYMPNAGLEPTRAAVASYLSTEYGVPIEPAAVLMTSGAAGGLNVALHSICEPGDEVILLAPHFPEYGFYVEQAGARAVRVPSTPEFQPDVEALERAIGPATRAVVVNSPNNPTGVCYTDRNLRALAAALRRHDAPERPLYLLLDDPYRRLVYDSASRVESPLAYYPRTLLISSYSKDLSIPGERMGYIAAGPDLPERAAVFGAMTMKNRTLGFVNASAFMQRVIARCADALCDVEFYRARRDRLCEVLADAGYEFTRPAGGMFLFPRTPIEDDAAFVELLAEQRVLAVPGRGFGRGGHMRLSFAVPLETIERSAAGFKAAREQARGRHGAQAGT